MKPQTLGDVTVSKLVEFEAPFIERQYAIPDSTREVFDAQRDWLAPHFFDYDNDLLIFSFHTFILKTPHHTILVDTCVGNHKERPLEHWHMRDGPYLEDLRAAGVAPESVDYVMCTHLHADHTGWNTRLQDGRWVPTFPNAKYLFSKDDWNHVKDFKEGDHGYAALQDSVMPIMEAGQAQLVDKDFQFDDAVRVEPTPGHTPGHYAVHLSSKGREGVLSGDHIHCPVPINRPDWSSQFCNDPNRSRETRIKFVDQYTDTDVMLFAAHFGGPTADHIRAAGDGCKFQLVEE